MSKVIVKMNDDEISRFRERLSRFKISVSRDKYSLSLRGDRNDLINFRKDGYLFSRIYQFGREWITQVSKLGDVLVEYKAYLADTLLYVKFEGKASVCFQLIFPSEGLDDEVSYTIIPPSEFDKRVEDKKVFVEEIVLRDDDFSILENIYKKLSV